MPVNLLLESGSKVLLESGSKLLLEPTVYTDSMSGSIAVTGSASESFNNSYTDSGSGSIAVTGSGVEQFGLINNDSGSGSITVSGSHSESYRHTDPGGGGLFLLESGQRLLLENGDGLFFDTPGAPGHISVTGSAIDEQLQEFLDAATGSIPVAGYITSEKIRVRLVLQGHRITPQAAETAHRSSAALLADDGTPILDDDGNPVFGGEVAVAGHRKHPAEVLVGSR
jgi:hypothetical protein